MKQGWEIKYLGEVCEFENGDRGINYPSKSHRTKTGIPFINAGHLTSTGLDISNMDFISRDRYNLLSNGKIQKDDILFCLRGSLGKFANVGELSEGAIASSLVIVRPNPVVNSAFIMAYFESHICADMISRHSNGAAQPNLSAGSLRKFQIPLPPLPEQQRIVAILDEAFAAIANAKAIAEQNLKNARELFESYLQSVFANKGEGWEEKRLEEVCEFKSGTTIPISLERNKGDVLYTKVADMNLPENQIEINTSSRFVNSNEIKNNQIIPDGSIIFPKRGGAIATNKKRKIVKPTIVDLNTMAIIPSKKINKDFLFHWFQQIDLNDISNGTSIPQINNYSFDEVYISFPVSLFTQQSIVQKLDALLGEAKKLEIIYQQKLNDLEELKKSILEKAFNGELKTA